VIVRIYIRLVIFKADEIAANAGISPVAAESPCTCYKRISILRPMNLT